MSEQEQERAIPEPDDAEGHVFRGGEPTDEKNDSDEGEDVEGHGFVPPGKHH